VSTFDAAALRFMWFRIRVESARLLSGFLQVGLSKLILDSLAAESLPATAISSGHNFRDVCPLLLATTVAIALSIDSESSFVLLLPNF